MKYNKIYFRTEAEDVCLLCTLFVGQHLWLCPRKCACTRGGGHVRGQGAAMLLDHLGEPKAAARIMAAVEAVSARGTGLSPDLGGTATTA